MNSKLSELVLLNGSEKQFYHLDYQRFGHRCFPGCFFNYIRTGSRGLFRTQSNIYDRTFAKKVWLKTANYFRRKSFIVGVGMGYKYAIDFDSNNLNNNSTHWPSNV